ncbi:hypothetical protein PSTT_09503 [Puccinia striiformis]|uniref:Uncharacterized protein n=1 Tax=Puccinia striiformis TaxID=27350 RepID=A0A2S4V890_9BASI|nr:hypothetical protein PSTT_09503 [Puccinia striiformis]
MTTKYRIGLTYGSKVISAIPGVWRRLGRLCHSCDTRNPGCSQIHGRKEFQKKIQIFNQHAMVLTQTLNYKSISHGKIADVILFGNPHFRAGPTQIFFWSGAGVE